MTYSRTLAAGEFKTHCLRVMDRVRSHREQVVITKNGVPVARLVPLEDARPADVFGCLAGEMEIVGDLVAPVDRAEDWEAS
jgi:prevent-host-death family protein